MAIPANRGDRTNFPQEPGILPAVPSRQVGDHGVNSAGKCRTRSTANVSIHQQCWCRRAAPAGLMVTAYALLRFTLYDFILLDTNE